jgi:hypothetical protein
MPVINSGDYRQSHGMARLSLLKPELKAAAIDIKDDRKAYVLWHISLVFLCGLSPRHTYSLFFIPAKAGKSIFQKMFSSPAVHHMLDAYCRFYRLIVNTARLKNSTAAIFRS